jgi:hypothetical protein
MKALRDILDGPFAEWLGDDDWTPWFAFCSALRAEPMSRRERKIYRRCTDRTELPHEPFTEAWVIAGRRARKSAIAAVLGCYFAVYGKWPRAAGETVRVLVIAVSKDQARIIRDYCEAILESRPGLQRLVEASDNESITLTNGVTIQCVANSFRSIRGPTVVCAIFEELAFWRSDNSANPDLEVLRAVRPSMLTVPGALLLGISSPYARRGLLYQKYRTHYGKDTSRVLVWKAPTQTMNPAVDERVIAEAYDDDPIAAAAEYGAEFRTDIESFVARDAVEAVISRGVREREPMPGMRYFAFVDPSGGSADAFTLAIGHLEAERAVLDAVREQRPPFSPESVVADYAALLKSYRVDVITGDKYAGLWPVERFQVHGIRYEQAAKPKSDLYRDLLPVINSGSVELLDNDVMLSQLCNLERRTARGGRDSIDHAPGAHDDVANAVAGVIAALTASKSTYDSTMSWVCADDSDGAWHAGRVQRYLNSGGLF